MKCPTPISIRAPDLTYTTSNIAVPCGRCGICLGNEITMWKIRLTEESKKQIANSFLTLTYNDENLPKNGVNKEHVQLFIKRMRKYWKFRYYLISEYGPGTNRPHYHAILFGIDNYTNDNMIQKIEKIWSKGFITLANVYPSRINYIAQYHAQKFSNPPGSNRNFKLLSSKPAIGDNYINREKNFHWGEKQMYYRNGTFKLALPRFYKTRLYDKATIRRASNKMQEQADIDEINKAMSDKNYYQKMYSSKQAACQQIINKYKKNRKL
ncbi:unnamed protein product [Rotaria socialis]|uniref:Replication-associated protein ORF2/G2P domain-containing protein n=1 Tax=Rotaria socialis TaxID=392032 RepID=A0A817TSL2_9BILA|nr:unnamed protein product [Rotaria socialis]CAF4550979.1 unnamed protein product [Rotaria socialis]